MPTQASVLQVRGLGKRKMAAVLRRAERLGMTTAEYLRHLVEEDLAISERAKKSSFAELLGPGERADEAEIDKLVDVARTDYHSGTARKE